MEEKAKGMSFWPPPSLLRFEVAKIQRKKGNHRGKRRITITPPTPSKGRMQYSMTLLACIALCWTKV